MSNSKPRGGIVHRIISSAADRLSQDPRIPADARDAFRATAISVFEQQVRELIGCDTVRLTGWRVTPSERQARRQRIEVAIKSGEPAGSIARRERVSESWVQKLGASARRGGGLSGT